MDFLELFLSEPRDECFLRLDGAGPLSNFLPVVASMVYSPGPGVMYLGSANLKYNLKIDNIKII